VAVPLVTSVGTFIDNKSVEFSPGTVGSGEKLIDVSVKRAAPLEQSDTEESAEAVRRGVRMWNILLLVYMVSV
jgi:hypothetical protein